ncbi:sigma-70 family RNA polymerase sigma factor [Acetonema longum]|uniref:RNA polymerase, sigma 28 subunit, FliA/WhiG family protein n=1 Tax=Acetonema longum DSM 6540 TaxID=1009370 RepID=F7NM25_9FIRM|nr:sigma-70 family RNA polymerase sigma factor [Acetonema longum]EGO62951.1 RNA polymerase, sigma 28 subunit, FliA/WhiG family protein [Acetonema longum DSM 6540]
MFGKYLAELKQIKLLEPAAEKELWRGYKEEGNLDCRQALIEHYQPLVFKTAARWRHDERAIMDIIQEGTVGLIEAVETFDYTKGVAFSLYAVHRIRGRMLNYLEREGKYSRNVADPAALAPYDSEDLDSWENMLVDSGKAISQQAEENFLAGQVKTALERLPLKEKYVLSGVYLNEQEPKILAEALDISLSHMYRLQKQGVRRLRGMLSKLMQHW